MLGAAAGGDLAQLYVEDDFVFEVGRHDQIDERFDESSGRSRCREYQLLSPDYLVSGKLIFSRVLRDSLSHFSVGPSVRRSVGRSVHNKVVLKVFVLRLLHL